MGAFKGGDSFCGEGVFVIEIYDKHRNVTAMVVCHPPGFAIL